MDQQAINAVFKPKSSKVEAKADQTTRVARGILAAEEARRDAKTARLKAARLARDAVERENATKANKPLPGSRTKRRAQGSSR